MNGANHCSGPGGRYLCSPVVTSIVLFVASCGGSTGSSSDGSTARPLQGRKSNLIIILVDTLRRDRIGAFGDEQGLTPYLDELVGESIRFPNAYSTCSWTKPAVASVMTGLYPGQHGAVCVELRKQSSWGSGVLPSAHVTLAEQMQAAGYSTAGFAANVHIRAKTLFDQGFETFEYTNAHGASMFERALEWVDDRAADEAFFLYTHLVDPHSPYVPRAPFDQGYTPEPLERAYFTNMGRELEIQWWLGAYESWEKSGGDEPFVFDYEAFHLKMKGRLPKRGEDFPDADSIRERSFLDFKGFDDPRLRERVRCLVQRYDGEVAYTSRAIERFMDGLGQRGLLENTTVLLVADHGEAFLEHGKWGHHNTLSAQEINVPMVLRVPGPDGEPLEGTFEVDVSLVDVYPTLLDIQGIPIPEGLSGVSLWPHIRTAGAVKVPSRAIFSELIEESEDRVAIIQDGRKLVRTADENGDVHWEMYDVTNDPGDFSPRAADESDPTTRTMMRRVGAFLLDRRIGTLPVDEEESLSAEDIAELKRLGYM